ncbi:heterokaryon incompatibility protein-domain-containing protein, partial [Halenospora varia]
MTEARPLYSYPPLPSPTHIRVIALKPSTTTNAALRCSIRHVNLDDYLGNYEAISYTWGRPVFDHSLRCSDGTRFAITANLHAALQSFRNIASTRLLWADAICINQNDSKEKNIQIKLMRRVYRTAHRVLVWLGSGVEDIEDTMNCLLLVTKVPFAALTGTSVKGREVSSVAKVNEPTVFIDTQKKRQLQIKRFLNLDWFSRRWIIQEVVLNSDVCLNYGQSDISWVRFMHAFQILGDVELLMEVEVPIQRSLSIMFELWQAHSLKRSVTSIERRDILSLLEAFHHFDCFDGRDRLFALAALVED